MRSSSSSRLLFVASTLLVIGIWMIAWPTSNEEERMGTGVDHPGLSTQESRNPKATLDALEKASSDVERYELARSLSALPVDDYRELLESIKLSDGHRLTVSARALLVHWASEDGPAATEWAWLQLREDGLFDEAFRQIGPAWAWRDAEGFGDWIKKTVAGRDDASWSVTKSEALASDAPILRSEDVSLASRWLLSENPRIASEVFLERAGWSSSDDFMWKSLTRPEQIRAALLAFDNLTVPQDGVITMGPEMYARALLGRWKELDQEGFEASPYAAYLPKPTWEKTRSEVDRWKSVAPEQRAESAARLLEISTDSTRRGVLATLTHAWAESDPSACRIWLESQPLEETSGAALVWTKVVAKSDPAGALEWSERFPPSARTRLQVAAFDAWTESNPDAEVSSEGWSASQKEVWEELEVLRQLAQP